MVIKLNPEGKRPNSDLMICVGSSDLSRVKWKEMIPERCFWITSFVLWYPCVLSPKTETQIH